MAEKEKLSQEQKLQAVLYCLEHQLDYESTQNKYYYEGHVYELRSSRCWSMQSRPPSSSPSEKVKS